MKGTIVVEEASSADVPKQDQIDAQAQEEIDLLIAQIDSLREASEKVRSEPGPNGTTTWFAQAGGQGRDPRVELYDFLPKGLDIQEGDTVVWTSPVFHNVVFHPGQDAPPFIVPKPQEQGPPQLTFDPVSIFPTKPGVGFDGTGIWSSGLIGMGGGGELPGGTSFSMTFNKAGTYAYTCTIHKELGMVGVVNVGERTVFSVAPFNASAGEFPEGLAVDKEGNIYTGMAPTGEIRKITPQGEVSTFANLPSPGPTGLMLGLEFDQAGNLYVAMNSGDAKTHGVWKVSGDGSKQELFASIKAGTFPNVVTFDSEGNLYVSDTIGGEIFKVDQAGTVSSWKQDQLMVGKEPPGLMPFPIGANGLAFDGAGENLYVANTELGRIVRISVNADGSAGEAAVFFEDLDKMGLPDGIVFDDADNLYVAVVGNDRIVKISPQAALTTLGEGFPLQNPSDLRFGAGADADTLYVANFAIFRMMGLAPGTPSPGILKLTVK